MMNNALRAPSMLAREAGESPWKECTSRSSTAAILRRPEPQRNPTRFPSKTFGPDVTSAEWWKEIPAQ